MNHESIRNCLLDLPEVQDFFRSISRPTLRALLPSHFIHYDSEKVPGLLQSSRILYSTSVRFNPEIRNKVLPNHTLSIFLRFSRTAKLSNRGANRLKMLDSPK